MRSLPALPTNRGPRRPVSNVIAQMTGLGKGRQNAAWPVLSVSFTCIALAGCLPEFNPDPERQGCLAGAGLAINIDLKEHTP